MADHGPESGSSQEPVPFSAFGRSLHAAADFPAINARYCHLGNQDAEKPCREPVCRLANGSFPSRHSPAAMPALPTARYLAPSARSCVDHPEMFAATVAALQAAVILVGLPQMIVHQIHPLLRCKSESLSLGRVRMDRWSVPGKMAPIIDAPTAQPTRQSSQWLSTAAGRIFHSSTVRPRPSVFTRYSAVICSARRRWIVGLSPKRERQPWSPIAAARRAWYEPFDQIDQVALALRFTLHLPVTAMILPGHGELVKMAVMLAQAGGLTPLNDDERGIVEKISEESQPILSQHA